MSSSGGSQDGKRRLAVVGAGNMGSGIAQKMATEGFSVILVDLDEERVAAGRKRIQEMLAEGVERKVFRPEQAEQILNRVEGTADWERLRDADLVVEAVFEDLDVKRNVFRRLDEVCAEDAVLATNTSSFFVDDVAQATRHPRRVIGLHYFYHPAKNRLVEVIPGKQTDPEVVRATWSLQEQTGKTPIASADAPGFIVNRYFVPWLNEAVRLLDEGVADIPTIEAAAKQAFGVGMGPFQLMNVTGVPIALHAATTLGQQLGPFYAPVERLRQQVNSGQDWPLDADGAAASEAELQAVAERMLAVVFYVAAALVDEGVGSLADTDIGARVGLRWPRGPFEMMNDVGVSKAASMVSQLTQRWNLPMPKSLAEQADAGEPFSFRLVNTEVEGGIAKLTINRPDAMNALNEDVVAQLHQSFHQVATDPEVRGIVIAGAGKAFVAGADLKFFVDNLDAKSVDRIVSFTKAGQDLLNEIDRCPKPVVARLHGLALGGGLELALACDQIIASTKAVVAFPETGIGIYPGLGGTQRTPRRVGQGLAKWLIFTGDMLTAKDAAKIGLVDRVVPYEALDEAIVEAISAGAPSEQTEPDASFAPLEQLFTGHSWQQLHSGEVSAGDDARAAKALKRVSHKAPLALQFADELIAKGSATTLEQGLQLELDRLVDIFGSADAYEGLSSVLQRRRPEFRGQ